METMLFNRPFKVTKIREHEQHDWVVEGYFTDQDNTNMDCYPLSIFPDPQLKEKFELTNSLADGKITS